MSETVATWCTGCGVFHAGTENQCVYKDEANYQDPFEGYRGKDPAKDAALNAAWARRDEDA